MSSGFLVLFCSCGIGQLQSLQIDLRPVLRKCSNFTGVSILFFTNFLLAQPAIDQPNPYGELGRFNLDSYAYTPSDNWIRNLSQDREGILYFVTSGKAAVQTFDGTHWGRIPLPQLESDFRTLRIFRDTLWLGSAGPNAEFGYIPRNDRGEFTTGSFTSLGSQLPENLSYDGAYSFHRVGPDYYFLLEGLGVVRWNKDIKDIWELPVGRRMYKIGEEIIVPTRKTLYRIRAGFLDSLPDWKSGFLQFLLPMPDNRALAIGTQAPHYQWYDGRSFTRAFPNTPVIDRISAGLWLEEGFILLGALDKGLTILDRDGRFVTGFNVDLGLANNGVTDLLQTPDGSIWIGTYYGLNRLRFPNPFTYFGKEHSIRNQVENLGRYNGILHVGNADGLFQLRPGNVPDRNARFEPVPGASWWIHCLLPTRGGLLLGTRAEGIKFYKDGTFTDISFPNDSDIMDIHQLRLDSSLYLIRTLSSLHLMAFRGGAFRHLSELMQIPGEMEMEEDGNGNVFVPEYTRLLQMDLSAVSRNQASLEQNLIFGNYPHRWHDLVGLGKVGENVVANKVIDEDFKNAEIRIFDDATDSFRKFDRIQPEFPGASQGAAIFESTPSGNLTAMGHPSRVPLARLEGKRDTLWTERSGFRLLRSDDGTFRWDRRFIPSGNKRFGAIRNIFPEKEGILWLAGWGGEVVRFDPSVNGSRRGSFQVYISEVSDSEGDSILFRGYAWQKQPIRWEPHNGSLRFRYAAREFDTPDSIYYRHLLVGYDREWSAWSHEAIKDYTQLPPGSFEFRVEALNAVTMERASSEFGFAISPPWYRTAWAYLLYVGLVIGAMYLFVHWRIRQLKADKYRLELLVQERTRQLEGQAVQLRELDAAKSRFFANISHELRTPLTLILAPLQLMAYGGKIKDRRPTIDIMLRNARRLHRLINQLLALAKMDSAEFSSDLKYIDLNVFSRRVACAFESLAEQKGIGFTVDTKGARIWVEADPEGLERIITNLLSNAFKFTGEGGQVVLRVRSAGHQGKEWALMEIRDTGIGIPPDKTEMVFDRFQRLNANREGSGIGLSLARELAQLYGGRIFLKPNRPKGSIFQVELPLHTYPKGPLWGGKSMLIPEENPLPPARQIPVPEPDDNKSFSPHLLIVEDNTDMRAFLRMVLGSEYRLTEAADGLQGFREALEATPDLILSDVMMPGMDGMDLCTRLKSDLRTSHIPVILLTARADRDSKLEGLGCRADAYLTKPFDKEELILVVANRIAHSRELRKKWQSTIQIEPSQITTTPADARFLEALMECVEKRLEDPGLGVNILIREMNMSRSQLHRKLKALTDLSATEFIRSFRLKRAHLLIEQETGSISEVAYAVGFNSPQYFSRKFREYFGYPPGKTAQRRSEAGTKGIEHIL